MYRTCLGSVSFVLGCVLLLIGLAQTSAHALDCEKLALYRGGTLMWCADPIIDPAGVDCDECVAVTGGSGKCSSTNRDEAQ